MLPAVEGAASRDMIQVFNTIRSLIRSPNNINEDAFTLIVGAVCNQYRCFKLEMYKLMLDVLDSAWAQRLLPKFLDSDFGFLSQEHKTEFLVKVLVAHNERRIGFPLADFIMNLRVQMPNEKDVYGQTPLHHLILGGVDADADRLVLSADNLNVQNALGDTPLHLAVKLDKKFFVLKLLAARLCDLSLKNNQGKTAVGLLIEKLGVLEFVRLFSSVKCFGYEKITDEDFQSVVEGFSFSNFLRVSPSLRGEFACFLRRQLTAEWRKGLLVEQNYSVISGFCRRLPAPISIQQPADVDLFAEIDRRRLDILTWYFVIRPEFMFEKNSHDMYPLQCAIISGFKMLSKLIACSLNRVAPTAAFEMLLSVYVNTVPEKALFVEPLIRVFLSSNLDVDFSQPLNSALNKLLEVPVKLERLFYLVFKELKYNKRRAEHFEALDPSLRSHEVLIRVLDSFGDLAQMVRAHRVEPPAKTRLCRTAEEALESRGGEHRGARLFNLRLLSRVAAQSAKSIPEAPEADDNRPTLADTRP